LRDDDDQVEESMKLRRSIPLWVALPVSLVCGLTLAVMLDEGSATAKGASKFTAAPQQLHINQRIGQAGVRRANLANRRIDELEGDVGAAGPKGARGPEGPQGPAASRIALSMQTGEPAGVLVEEEGLVLTAQCAVAGAKTALSFSGDFAEPTTLIVSGIIDSGTDLNNPTQTNASNFQVDVPAGKSPLGGPEAQDTEFFRLVQQLLFVQSTRTYSVHLATVISDPDSTCDLNGVAIAAE
jgi:hypothetical protein